MSDDQLSSAEWQALFDAVDAVKKLAPWEFMNEMDMFAVRHPDTGEIGFVSVMGQLGEHLAVALYLGPKALREFMMLLELGDRLPPDALLTIRHLQLSFEDRDMLENPDRQLIKRLGRRYRGRQAWPVLRSFQAFYVPWYLEPADARFLTLALQQLLDVAPRFAADRDLLPDMDGVHWLMREQHSVAGQLVWRDNVGTIDEPGPSHEEIIEFDYDEFAIAFLKRQSPQPLTVEVDTFINFETPIGERNERPYYPFVALMVESDSGYVLGIEILDSREGIGHIWSQLPGFVLHHLATADLRPRTLRVRSGMMFQLLEPLAEELDANLRQTPTLPALDEARDSLLDFFSR